MAGMSDSSSWAGFHPDAVGHTPLVEIEGVLVKLECANPSGSVKDRIGVFMLREAIRRGELAPGDTVVEATSGNTGIALSLAGRALGLNVLIFMPEHMSAERRSMMERLGADVRLTPREESFTGACARRDAYADRAGYYVPDQFGNPDNTRCHRETTGRELVAQLRERGVDRLAAVVAGIGTGGTLMGLGQALALEWPHARVVAVEPTESAVLSGGPVGEHGIMGIGDGFVPALVERGRIDEVITVSSEEAHAAAERIRREHGFCVGRSSGANLLAALRLGSLEGRVVTVFPDCSDRYQSLGLGSPGSPDVHCPMCERCRSRTRELLGP